MPLHLEQHLDAATVVGSDVPEDLLESVEWRFDEPQPDWKVAKPSDPTIQPVAVTRTGDALRVTMTEATRDPQQDGLTGYLFVEVPGWNLEDWDDVLVRARASNVTTLGLGFNLRGNVGTPLDVWRAFPFRFFGWELPIIDDGSVQTYRLRAESWAQLGEPLRELGLWFYADEPGDIEVLSVRVTTQEGLYADAPSGVRQSVRDDVARRALYTHAPGRFEYRVQIPEAGRLDFAMGVLREDTPVEFRVTARPDGPRGREPVVLFEESYAGKEGWAQRSVDLAEFAAQKISLTLEADAETGTVALWAVPTLTGSLRANRPNVIFYIIDGAGADYMNVYGYNRRTTPNLERLAEQGAVFERAYSNSTWTRPSTPSFLTSLQHSVFGGMRNDFNAPPPEVLPMAEHFHRAGYQTATFTSNPNAGSMSRIERGTDIFREAGVAPSAVSSRELHSDFWRWREAYPGEPYWVHFQTTDVHYPHEPVAPFAGMFVDSGRRAKYEEWRQRLVDAGGDAPVSWSGAAGPYSASFAKTGLSRIEYFAMVRGLYDETMAHQDHQLGRLVERLKAAGEWEHTILVIASDHGLSAGAKDFHMGMLEPLPAWWGPMFRPSVTRIPLIVVWPERIEAGQRFGQPVSMIDALPTVLDLAGLPMPEVMQGQSLGPLLLGQNGWEPRPVILEELYLDRETGELGGVIEVVDGRWGASLRIGPMVETGVPGWSVDAQIDRPAPLLLYDLWNDPQCLIPFNAKRPDLVEKYTDFLETRWTAHQALAQRFSRESDVALTREQLETLRALGYIR